MGTDAQITVRVSILKDIAEALGAAADALAKLGDSIAHLIGLGVRGYAVGHARADVDRLQSLLTHLITNWGGNVGTISYIDEFIEDYIKTRGQLEHFMPNGVLVLTGPPSEYILHRTRYFSGVDAGMSHRKTVEAWNIIRDKLKDLFANAPILLEELETKKGGFVLDKTYMDLVSILTQRANVLTKLADFPPPHSDEEIEALRAVTEQYRKLKDRLGQASQALAAYIKANTGEPVNLSLLLQSISQQANGSARC